MHRNDGKTGDALPVRSGRLPTIGLRFMRRPGLGRLDRVDGAVSNRTGNASVGQGAAVVAAAYAKCTATMGTPQLPSPFGRPVARPCVAQAQTCAVLGNAGRWRDRPTP